MSENQVILKKLVAAVLLVSAGAMVAVEVASSGIEIPPSAPPISYEDELHSLGFTHFSLLSVGRFDNPVAEAWVEGCKLRLVRQPAGHRYAARWTANVGLGGRKSPINAAGARIHFSSNACSRMPVPSTGIAITPSS